MSIAWFIAITVFILLVQSYIFSKWGLLRVHYKRSFNHKAVYEGEEIEMIDVISNQKILPLPWLRLESMVDPNLKIKSHSNKGQNEYFRSLFSFLPYQKTTRKHWITCSKRGHYELKTVTVTVGDPFGFGETFESIEAPAVITVYPRLLPLKDIPLPSHSFFGDIIVKRWIIEDPFVLAGVREYTQGDPMNHVNWNATARTGHLQVNKKDYTVNHHFMIYLNLDETEDVWLPIQDEVVMEKGLSYAASIAQYAIGNGISTGFGCNSYIGPSYMQQLKEPIRIQPESGSQHLTRLLETMAKLNMDRSKSFHQFLKADLDKSLNNTDILIITTMLTDTIKHDLKKLESQGNAVQILWLEKGEEAPVLSEEGVANAN